MGARCRVRRGWPARTSWRWARSSPLLPGAFRAILPAAQSPACATSCSPRVSRGGFLGPGGVSPSHGLLVSGVLRRAVYHYLEKKQWEEPSHTPGGKHKRP